MSERVRMAAGRSAAALLAAEVAWRRTQNLMTAEKRPLRPALPPPGARQSGTLLRHSPEDLSVTKRYAHLAPDHLVEALDKLDELNAKCNASVIAIQGAAPARSRDIN